MALDDLVYDRN